MVRGAPAAAEVAAGVVERCEGRTLVFHNAAFDLPFIAALMRRTGRPPLLGPVVDTLGLARGLFDIGGNALGALAARLELPAETSHRALGDALTTARLLLVLGERWEREKGVRSVAELAAASQDVLRLTNRRMRG
jgi:DNA polymerase III epsilon subunit-like protein